MNNNNFHTTTPKLGAAKLPNTDLDQSVLPDAPSSIYNLIIQGPNSNHDYAIYKDASLDYINNLSGLSLPTASLEKSIKEFKINSITSDLAIAACIQPEPVNTMALLGKLSILEPALAALAYSYAMVVENDKSAYNFGLYLQGLESLYPEIAKVLNPVWDNYSPEKLTTDLLALAENEKTQNTSTISQINQAEISSAEKQAICRLLIGLLDLAASPKLTEENKQFLSNLVLEDKKFARMIAGLCCFHPDQSVQIHATEILGDIDPAYLLTLNRSKEQMSGYYFSLRANVSPELLDEEF